MKIAYIVIGVLLVTVLAIVLLLPRQRRADSQEIVASPILTPNECEFFHRLLRALPEHHIFPQVAFGAILGTRGSGSKTALRNRFNRKYADFVICARETLGIVAIVELDDRTHNAAKDAERDQFLHAAGYRVIRFESRKKPSEAEIATLFQQGRLVNEPQFLSSPPAQF
ncbi:MAG: DUF2726 domain-containing protein [Alphaproteobacteria bacterium]|nr:DUF2726 domain-containing protein [Alphaproteobacteria bacterium]